MKKRVYNKTRSNQFRNYRLRLRRAIFVLLKEKCRKCGFSDIRALQIDHINGGGVKDIQAIKIDYHKHVLESLVKGEKKYQLLCANCNWIKRSEKNENKPSKFITK